MQAKDTCILTLVSDVFHSERQKSRLWEGRLEVWPSNTVCKLLVLPNTVSWVVLLWEIQSACAEEAQTGQVRGVLRVLGRAGECPASNMTHTELPSAPLLSVDANLAKGCSEFSHSQDAPGLLSKNHQEAL